MGLLYKVIAVLGLSAVLAFGPAIYVHLQDNKAENAALKQQADGYNAVYAKAQEDSAAQLKALQEKAAVLVASNTTLQTQYKTALSKAVTVIHNAPKDQCTDVAAPADIIEQLRQPPRD